MGAKWQKILATAIGINPIEINSALVSAQNRRRLYFTNIGAEPDGLFGDLVCKIPQPKDRGILLKDVLESDVDEKYYIKNPKFGFDGMDTNGKNNTLRTGGHQSQTKKHNYDIIKVNKEGKVSPNQDKASCFTAGGNSGGNHSDMDLIVQNAVEIVAMRGRNPENPSDRTTGAPTEQRLEPRGDGKTNCLTTVQKDNLVYSYRQDTPVKEGSDKFQTLRHNPGGKSRGVGLELKTSRIRRLTPVEVCRLQTISDDYFKDSEGNFIVSETQVYKCTGNGWIIEVISHIFNYLK